MSRVPLRWKLKEDPRRGQIDLHDVDPYVPGKLWRSSDAEDVRHAQVRKGDRGVVGSERSGNRERRQPKGSEPGRRIRVESLE